MGNKPTIQDEIKLKAKCYKFITLTELNKAISLLKQNKPYTEVYHFIIQSPISATLKNTIDIYYLKSKHFRPTYLSFDQICYNINKQNTNDIKIGLSKPQYEYLQHYLNL